MRTVIFYVVLMAACLPHVARAQVSGDTLQRIALGDTLLQMADTSLLDARPFQPIAKKAALYSGIFPGMGQVYVGQYWKLPIIYAGAGAAAYFITLNLNQYRTYRKAYIARLSGEPDSYDYLTDQDLRVLQDGYKRNLDMAVLFSALGYTVQILDALAAAHLKNFDISEDISLRFQPLVAPNGGVGWGVAVNFK